MAAKIVIINKLHTSFSNFSFDEGGGILVSFFGALAAFAGGTTVLDYLVGSEVEVLLLLVEDEGFFWKRLVLAGPRCCSSFFFPPLLLLLLEEVKERKLVKGKGGVRRGLRVGGVGSKGMVAVTRLARHLRIIFNLLYRLIIILKNFPIINK